MLRFIRRNLLGCLSVGIGYRGQFLKLGIRLIISVLSSEHKQYQLYKLQ